MLGAAKEESKDTKPVNSATVIPPFTASHALAQEVENLGLLKRGGIVGMMMMMMMMLMMMMMMMREKNMYIYIYIHIHPNVKLSAFPETTYKLHGTLRIQEVSAVSAKKKVIQHGNAIPNMLLSMCSNHDFYQFISSKQHGDAWLKKNQKHLGFINKKLQNTMGRTSLA